jgi:hypothetical protein
VSHCAAILLVAGCATAAIADAPLTVKAGRGARDVRVATEEGVVVIDVASPGGIGEITVQNGGQPWPMEAKLRLRYDERRHFASLEGLTISDSQSQLHTFLGATMVEIMYRDGAVRRDDAKPIIKITKDRGVLEITLPLAWFADEKEFVVHWVDFYRN